MEGNEYNARLEAAAGYLAPFTGHAATALILGSGLGGFTERITDARRIPYGDIPGFPATAVQGHAGELVCGMVNGAHVLAFSGRFHYYEGHSARDVAWPAFLAARLGAKRLVVSNAAGGINAGFDVGDIMLITDHINLTGTNPLIGPHHAALGPRFPDMSRAYCPELAELAHTIAHERDIPLREGVYLGITGPSYETAAEIRAFRALGADAVGMSTVFEVIAAAAMGLNVLGFSVITNMATGLAEQPHAHEHVLAAAARAAEHLGSIVSGMLCGE